MAHCADIIPKAERMSVTHDTRVRDDGDRNVQCAVPEGTPVHLRLVPRSYDRGYDCAAVRALSTSPVPAAQLRPSVGLTVRQAQGGLWHDCPRHPEGPEFSVCHT
jgi:hypothetical protein